MPPRARKVDPAQLRQQFEDWKKSDEWANWEKLLDARREINLTATSPDILIDLSKFLSDLWRLSSILKVPRKSQGYDQLYLKTSFFPQVALENKMTVDGLNFELQKSSVDAARDCREDFIKVLGGLELFSELEAENFLSHKKDLIKKLTNFEKTYMAHLKKGHDYILDSVLSVILKPLSEALDANMNLYYLQYRDHEKRKWFRDPAPDFRLSACKERFSDTMRDLIVRLKDHGPLMHLPNIMKSLSRLEIDTSSHDALKFFVSPVKKAWRELRSAMKATFKRGLVRYRHPVRDNVEIVEALKKLLDVDLRAEQLLGDSLKKDQLEFIYDVLHHIMLSPFKDQLKAEQKENDVLKHEIIPQLATFKALQQMYQANQDIALREKELREVGLDLEAAKPDNSGAWTQDKEVRYDGIKRVWVWENYIRETDKPEWEEASRMVEQVNLMVQEDLADFFIARHLKGKFKNDAPDIRPPYVWNHYLLHNRYVKKEEPLFKEEEAPPEVKQVQKFRPYVRPEEYYLDGRVQRLIEVVESLARGLRSHQPEMWTFLIDNVIEALKQDKPDSGAEDISFEEEQKEAEEVKEEQKVDA
jgi:hypothetical protein